jgi:hypothetical protein
MIEMESRDTTLPYDSVMSIKKSNHCYRNV